MINRTAPKISSSLAGVGTKAGAAHAAGPTPPVAPADPKSEDECRDYQRQHNEYLEATKKRNDDCQASALKLKNPEFVSVTPPCGGKAVLTYKRCQDVSGIAWCATIDFAPKYKKCLEQALKAERKPFDDAVAKNNERQSKEELSPNLGDGRGQAAAA